MYVVWNLSSFFPFFSTCDFFSISDTMSGYFIHGFNQIFMNLCRCFVHGLKICIWFGHYRHFHFYNLSKIVSEYNQKIPQSQTADKPVASLGRATQQSRDTRNTNKAKQPALSSPSR